MRVMTEMNRRSRRDLMKNLNRTRKPFLLVDGARVVVGIIVVVVVVILVVVEEEVVVVELDVVVLGLLVDVVVCAEFGSTVVVSVSEVDEVAAVAEAEPDVVGLIDAVEEDEEVVVEVEL